MGTSEQRPVCRVRGRQGAWESHLTGPQHPNRRAPSLLFAEEDTGSGKLRLPLGLFLGTVREPWFQSWCFQRARISSQRDGLRSLEDVASPHCNSADLREGSVGGGGIFASSKMDCGSVRVGNTSPGVGRQPRPPGTAERSCALCPALGRRPCVVPGIPRHACEATYPPCPGPCSPAPWKPAPAWLVSRKEHVGRRRRHGRSYARQHRDLCGVGIAPRHTSVCQGQPASVSTRPGPRCDQNGERHLDWVPGAFLDATLLPGARRLPTHFPTVGVWTCRGRGHPPPAGSETDTFTNGKCLRNRSLFTRPFPTHP